MTARTPQSAPHSCGEIAGLTALPVPSSACVEWSGRLNHQRYGLVRKDGREYRAHRVAWEEANGPIPDGLWVLHHCDNPPCVNVDHLYVGTAADNARDRTVRGRQPRPLACPRGHAYTGSNSDFRPTTKYVKRRCRTCHADEERARRRTKTGDICAARSEFRGFRDRVPTGAATPPPAVPQGARAGASRH